ncbi:universal stress protein [Lacisediminihabitans profunda]|uniref:Universal stress protein n=1 Tax=Lacisediminihabitans profunda TaxID=2594790 RepID=A0A5C8UNG8_9MICO|nr:universal stress protein [Lacisediminihabitans profunda]TXN28969.1 universal stress protein [Lacisediminihabitans profunda]
MDATNRAEQTIVGWDRSPAAHAALAWAIDRERPRNGTVTLLWVFGDIATSRHDLETARTLAAKDARQAMESAPEVTVLSEVVLGEPYDRLLSRSEPGSLIAVGVHDRTSRRVLRGASIGLRLAASAPGPVAIIPAPHGEREGVVVGVDGSEASLNAARFAAREAERRGEVLTVIHGWLEPSIWLDAFPLEPEFLLQLQEAHDLILNQCLAIISQEFPDLRVSGRTARGHIPRSILEASPSAALVVVGSQSRRLVGRTLLGSVSHEVMLNLEVPAVVVHSPAPDGVAPTSATSRTAAAATT